MQIIEYKKKNHGQIIRACAEALKQGKVVAYPTDTSYGLAADAENITALKRLYRIKERDFKQPVHVVVPSLVYAKKNVVWGKDAQKLATNFWPGALTLVLKIKAKEKYLDLLAAKTGFLGLRLPKNLISQDLAKMLRRPITATSANPSLHLSGGYDSYSGTDVVAQFKNKKYRPDIVIDAGRLPKRGPSTVLKLDQQMMQVLRPGPISEKQIIKILKK